MENFRTFLREMCRCCRDNENENGNKNLYAELPVPVDTRTVEFEIRIAISPLIRHVKKKIFLSCNSNSNYRLRLFRI